MGQMVATEGMGNIVPMEWHSGGTLYTPEGANRASYYGVTGLPTCVFDGTGMAVGAYPGNVPQTIAYYMGFYTPAHNNPAYVYVTIIDKSVGGGVASIKFNIYLEQGIASGHVAHIVLWEDHVVVGSTDWRYVERAYTSKNVTISNGGESQLFTHTFTLNGAWNPNNLGISVIIQNPTSKVCANSAAAACVTGTGCAPTSLGRIKALFN